MMFAFWILFFITLVIIYIFFLPVEIKEKITSLFQGSQDELKAHLRALERNPANTQALEYLGKLHFDQKDYKVAYDYYSRLLVEMGQNNSSASSINRFQLYLHLGISAYHLDLKSEALTSLQKAKLILNSARTFELFFYLGLLHFETENYLEAISMLDIACKQVPGNRDAIFKLALSNYALNRFEIAFPLFDELADSNNPGEIDFYRGICLVQIGKTEEALNCFSKVAENLDYRFKCWCEMFRIYLKLQNNDLALGICQNIIALKEEGLPAEELCFVYYHGAKIQAGLGLLNEAIATLRMVLDIDVQYKDASSLYKHYVANKECIPLFILCEGGEQVRHRVIRSLVSLLVPDADTIELINEQPGAPIIALAVSPEQSKYYIWISLQVKEFGMRQAYDIHVKSKEYHCTHCIIACLYDLQKETEYYVKGRPIRLIGSAELHKLINQTASV